MGTGRWRHSGTIAIVLGLTAIAATLAVLAALKLGDLWVQAAVMAGGAVFAALTPLWQERYKRLTTRRAEVALKIENGCLVLADGRLPKVSQITDPIVLGVHPCRRSAHTRHGDARVPTYVPRDIDEELHRRLDTSGFVLLIGDSTAGKSRTAYEAVQAVVPGHTLIAPDDRTSLLAAVERATRLSKVVLWLNDLEYFLGGAGLTKSSIARVVGGTGHHRVIVATLRCMEEDRLTSQAPDADENIRRAGQDARQALEQAHPMRLSRMFTTAERERARTQASDDRIRAALEHAEEYGIAEYLAAGPELLRDCENAWEPGANPRGAALVAAAIDCRRAGFHSPVPRRLLEELHEHYLVERGGHRLRPGSLEDAWEWATRPRRATTALLSPLPETDTVKVFDYLVDARQHTKDPLDGVPDVITLTSLEHASATDAGSMADVLDRQGRYLPAERAWRKAFDLQRIDLGEEHPDTLTSRNNMALMLRDLGRWVEAESENRAVLAARRRVLGEEHPDTLASRNNLAGVLRDLGRLTEAETEHRAALTARRRVLGEEHPDTLTSRNNLAGVIRRLGRPAEAEAEHRAILAVRLALGEEHPDTLISRNNLALVLRDLGRYEQAEAEHRAVLAGRGRVLGVEHPSTLTSRHNLAVTLRHLGRLAEAETESRTVLAARRRVLGESHPKL